MGLSCITGPPHIFFLLGNAFIEKVKTVSAALFYSFFLLSVSESDCFKICQYFPHKNIFVFFFFDAMASYQYTLSRTSESLNKMSNPEHVDSQRLLHGKNEEAAETIESSRFFLVAFGAFVLPPVIMDDISSKWNFSSVQA